MKSDSVDFSKMSRISLSCYQPGTERGESTFAFGGQYYTIRGRKMEFSTSILKRLDEKLKGIACKITRNEADQDDLMQEMRIYLWEKSEKFKDKTESYILRACYFQATHCHCRGKSIDSKPRKNVIIVSLGDMETLGSRGQACLTSVAQNCPTLNRPSIVEEARHILITEEIKKLIRAQLNSKLKRTFDLLIEGHSLSGIAQDLNLSYEAARMRVKKIRKAARVYLEENLVFW